MLLAFFTFVSVINFNPVYSDSDYVVRNKRSDDYVPCEWGWYYFHSDYVVRNKRSDDYVPCEWGWYYFHSDYVVRNKRSDDYVPCEWGWYYFRYSCYRVGGRKYSERLQWEKALERCRSYGGDLVSIQSQEEQDFITSFLLLDVKAYVWIGLNDREKDSDYRWTDGSVFNYTNWDKVSPSGTDYLGTKEDCVQMLFLPAKDNDIIGQWNDRQCDVTEAYICEMDANPRKRSPNPVYCSSEEGGGWKYESSCYHVVKDTKSWQDAEKHCKYNYNGHLITVLDTLVDTFLEHILANVNEEMWIGIKVKNQLQQKWTSGWYVSYDGFDKEHIDFKPGTCAARVKRKEWITLPCTDQLAFVCEVSKVSPPVLKVPERASHCPVELDDWRDLGGEYCYYFATNKTVNFYEALFDCKRRGGNLVSIHSKEESAILQQFVQYTRTIWAYFIGLIRVLAREDQFAWTDGSPMNYENWRYNEPNDEATKCVEALDWSKMEWNDISCTEKRSYICSVKKIPNTAAVKEEGCASFCVDQSSYMYELLSQSTDAKRLP